MSSKIMLGLLMSAAVGLGATAASADENVAPQYDYHKKAVIDVDDYFCKVPIKIKGDKVVLASEDAKIRVKEITYNYKKYILAKCDFKTKVDYYYYKDIAKKDFKCELRDFGKYDDLKTDRSFVHVDFDRKWGRKGYYKDDKRKHVVAKVHLECLFKKPHDPHYYPPKNDNNKDDGNNY